MSFCLSGLDEIGRLLVAGGFGFCWILEACVVPLLVEVGAAVWVWQLGQAAAETVLNLIFDG